MGMDASKARQRADQALARQQDPAFRQEMELAKARARKSLGGAQVPEPAKATRALSYALDNMFRVPGTEFRFGIDPVLSFFPAVGAGMGALFGSVILADAVRLRAPVTVLARMVGNHVINWLFGMIPVIGPVFDAWWKSNARNVKLLDRTLQDREQVRKASVFYWVGVAVLAVIAVGLVIAAPIALLWWLDALVTGR